MEDVFSYAHVRLFVIGNLQAVFPAVNITMFFTTKFLPHGAA